jgi:hypothetical protein
MAIQTTIDIPEHLHEVLRAQADALGTSIPQLVIRAIEDVYPPPRKKGKMVTGPFIKGPMKPGPEFPTDENPHDLVFS